MAQLSYLPEREGKTAFFTFKLKSVRFLILCYRVIYTCKDIFELELFCICIFLNLNWLYKITIPLHQKRSC